MTSTLTTPTDFYLLVIPALFGFVFAFVFALGVYHCATLSRVKGTCKKRNRVLESRLAHSLAYCDEHNVTSVYDTLRELGYGDLCNLPKSDSRSASGSFSSSSSKHKNSHKKSKSKSREASSEESGESAERSVHQSHSPPRQHESPRNQHSRRSQRTRSSFVLEEVHMMDSDDDYSNDS